MDQRTTARSTSSRCASAWLPARAGSARCTTRSSPANRSTRRAEAAMSPLKTWLDDDGAFLRLRLARPKANIVDAPMVTALHAALAAQSSNHTLRGVLLDAEGPHFSFGASVEEHLPDSCAQMLSNLHALVVAMVEFPLPILV